VFLDDGVDFRFGQGNRHFGFGGDVGGEDFILAGENGKGQDADNENSLHDGLNGLR
jgi:hypothetical protein